MKPSPATPRSSWLDRKLRSAVVNRLRALRNGHIELCDADSSTSLGEPDADLAVRLYVKRPRFFRRLAFGGGLGAAESLMDGDWTCDDLTALVRIFIRNRQAANGLDRGFARLKQLGARLAHAIRLNSRAGSRRNIAAHYDVGNEFYQLMLDPTMTYSCGVYERETSTLEEASLAKIDRLCRKLALCSTDHLLEIGTGWGGFAIYAARNYGCRVTTTTISPAQYEMATSRVRLANLSDRIEVRLQDYRDLTGRYDKLVSVEMIEAVGHQFYNTFFRQCANLLKPQGLMALQGIVIVEQAYAEHLRTIEFIRKYIFPGGCLPSIAALQLAAGTSPDLRLVHLEDLAPHYVRTLRDWRSRFTANLPQVRELGYPERFIRMWDYYLAYCEATFAERHVNDVQMVWAKPQAVIDPTAWIDWSRDEHVSDHAGQRPADCRECPPTLN